MTQSTFLSQLAEHLRSNYNLQQQDVTVVFPNKRAAFYLRNALKENNPQTLWLPQMLSIEEAVTQWSRIELADSIDLLFELIDIDAQVPHDQEHKSDLNTLGSQAAQMAKDFDEIDQYGIDAEKVFNYVVENKRLEFWTLDEGNNRKREEKYLDFFKSLYDYYQRLRERLSEQGKGYYGMITRHLAELPENKLLEKVGDGKIIFAGFNALTATEERIINTLVRNGKAETIFDYDHYYLDDENNEAGHFARLHQTKHPEWLKNEISDRLRQEEKTIHIISVSGNALQAKALQAKLQETDDKNQTVVLADEHLLIPVLNAIPDNGTYDSFKVSMGYPINKTPANQLVKAYLALCRRNKIKRNINDNGTMREANGWYIWPVLRLMDLEIVKIVFPKTETAAFNRWKTEAVKSGKFIIEEKDIDNMSRTPGIQEFLRIILTGTNENTPQSVLENLGRFLAFITRTLLDKEESSHQNFLLNQVSEIGKIINRLQHLVERHSTYIQEVKNIETLYRLLSSGATIRLKSDDTEGLQIMGLLETRNLAFERLHLLSVNEDILPPGKSQGCFIPHFIRHFYGLPSHVESQAVVAYNFYRLLQNGKDIYLYYNSLGDSSGGEASRFILQIKYELAKYPNIKIEEEDFASQTKSSLEAKVLKANKGDAIDRLRYLIEEKGLSPSALSTYLHCPLKYYLHYIAQIKDSSIEEDMGANDIGTVIHDTLELLFADYLPHDGTQPIIDKDLFDKLIQPQWKEKLEQSIVSNFPNGFPDMGYNFLNRVTIEQQLNTYLEYTSKQLEHSNLSIIKTEGDLKAVLPTDLGEFVFSGRADRIDKCNGVIRVIDYKTGHVDNSDLKVPVRHYSESDLDYLRKIPDKALQLLLYKYMYLKGNPTPDPVKGAIHGLRYPSNIEFCLTKATPSRGDTDVDDNFLKDESFINDMESMLEAVVDEMLDISVPFTQTEDNKKCKYCDYKVICKR